MRSLYLVPVVFGVLPWHALSAPCVNIAARSPLETATAQVMAAANKDARPIWTRPYHHKSFHRYNSGGIPQNYTRPHGLTTSSAAMTSTEYVTTSSAVMHHHGPEHTSSVNRDVIIKMERVLPSTTSATPTIQMLAARHITTDKHNRPTPGWIPHNADLTFHSTTRSSHYPLLARETKEAEDWEDDREPFMFNAPFKTATPSQKIEGSILANRVTIQWVVSSVHTSDKDEHSRTLQERGEHIKSARAIVIPPHLASSAGHTRPITEHEPFQAMDERPSVRPEHTSTTHEQSSAKHIHRPFIQETYTSTVSVRLSMGRETPSHSPTKDTEHARISVAVVFDAPDRQSIPSGTSRAVNSRIFAISYSTSLQPTKSPMYNHKHGHKNHEHEATLEHGANRQSPVRHHGQQSQNRHHGKEAMEGLDELPHEASPRHQNKHEPRNHDDKKPFTREEPYMPHFHFHHRHKHRTSHSETQRNKTTKETGVVTSHPSTTGSIPISRTRPSGIVPSYVLKEVKAAESAAVKTKETAYASGLSSN
jgi:hypothetical protein